MSLAIPPDLEQFIHQEISSGNYQTADEVISEGLRLLRERKLYELRKDIDAGLAHVEMGEVIHISSEQAHRAFFADVQARGMQRYEARRNEK